MQKNPLKQVRRKRGDLLNGAAFVYTHFQLRSGFFLLITQSDRYMLISV
jgi:hypothetical protein